MKLISNWKDSWKWFSTQAMLLAVAVQGAWDYIPADMRASLPDGFVTWATMGLLVLGIIGRTIRQGGEE